MTNPACLNLPVYTTLGRYVGRIKGVELEADTGQVARYQVASAVTLPNLWHRRVLLISSSQVVSLTSQVMIVRDESTTEPAKVNPGLAVEPTS